VKLDRMDIVVVAENIDLYEDDYSIRESYPGRYGVTGAGVVLPDNDVTPFMVALAVHLAEDDRGEDALSLGRKARTDSMGTGTIVYWGGVEIVA
jgi:hypothetical protein